ncbi:MAG: DEAD/DEAH box helicase [Niameybacter sp.]
MDLKRVPELLQLNTDSMKYKSGQALYMNQCVCGEYAHTTETGATFYANVKDEYHRQSYTCMANIDARRGTIEASCDCQSAIHLSGNAKICSHVVATVLKGIESLRTQKEVDPDKDGVVYSPMIHLSMEPARNGGMKLQFSIEGIEVSEQRKIYTAFKEGKKLYRLQDGSCLDLGEPTLVESLQFIEILGLYNDFEALTIPPSKMFYLEQYLEEHTAFIEGQEYVAQVMAKSRKKQKANAVPTQLQSVLRDYQEKGFEFLSTVAGYGFGGILADEMGLGKTLQVIAFLLSQQDKKSLIITPTALVYNWKKEFEKFAPSLKVAIVHGHKERGQLINKYQEYDVLLTTYATYKNDIAFYSGKKFDFAIIDEAQTIKNPDAVLTRTIKTIKASVKFALTGTPIENNLLELWSIFDFVMPEYLYSRSKFQKVFMSDNHQIGALKELIKPFLLRRTKKEVASQLPDKIEQKFYVPLEVEHARAYRAFTKLAKEKVFQEDGKGLLAFTYLTKLRQLALMPEWLVKNYAGQNSKLEVLVNLIKEAEGKKILVFSQFTKVLGHIGERLQQEGIGYSYLDGSTEAKKRLELVDQFNETDDHQVFLISLKAGGTGLNLTSASMVIHFDPWWNPAVQDQATDRAHRIGQSQVVNVISLIAKGTVEERIVELQESKKELIEAVMEQGLNNEGLLKKLTTEELVSLFEII